MNSIPDSAQSVDAELHDARTALEQGRMAEAEAVFMRVVDLDSNHVEALHHLGLCALARGAGGEAVSWLGRAASLDRRNAALLKNLGIAYVAAKRPDEARFVLEGALQIDPAFFVARLHLAKVFEDIGHPDQALIQYFGAVTAAQNKGRWLSEETTAPALRALVLHAMNTIDAGRKRLFEAAVGTIRAQHGEAALTRVMHCLDIYLHAAPANYADPRQLPRFLYFPDLPTTPYFDRALFPWYAQLESNVDVIRAELLEVLREEKNIVPFLGINDAEKLKDQLAGADAPPVWDAFFFYRHGVRFDENCARCPRTAAILDSLPLVRIREHAPEICFSLLTPGTHILPHRGVTNTRVVTHLPLIVHENCALVVGGEKREWCEGECFTFDDTFEHEAWNRGNSLRVVMLIDCWNPHLTAVERDAVATLVAAIGDFNREADISAN